MGIRFSDDVLERSRSTLLGPEGNGLIRLMSDISLNADISGAHPNLIEEAKSLGWLTASCVPTPQGYCAADSCREYHFWMERGKKLPFDPAADHMTPGYFADKSIVEIGTGAGLNLLSLQHVAKSLTGIETVEAYIQMGRIFCEKEGLAPPYVIPCPAERISCTDSSFEVALCVSALHYFDIVPALREIARVLMPGGEVLIIDWTLGDFLRAFRPSKSNAIALVNTGSYMALEKRLIPGRGDSSTSRPVFPSIFAISRWMRQAGLDPLEPSRTGGEWCLRGRKPRKAS